MIQTIGAVFMRTATAYGFWVVWTFASYCGFRLCSEKGSSLYAEQSSCTRKPQENAARG
jgi:hypothetical protein